MGRKKKVADTKFYDIMGVSIDVSQEDLKKAYKRKALQLHPDKRGNSPHAQDEFTKMKTAYDVLSDPQKREIYDTMGTEGLKMIEDFGSLDPEEMSMIFLRSLSATGPKGKCIMITVLFSVVAFFFLIPVFWCLRIDGSVEWDWGIVFIPVWIFDALVFCCVGFSFAGNSDDDANDDGTPSKNGSWLKKWGRALKAILFLAQQIFIVLHLNETVNWSFFVIFAPIFVFEAIHLTGKLIYGYIAYSRLRKKTSQDSSQPVPSHYKMVLSLFSSITSNLLVVAFFVLLSLKLEHTISVSWWLMFLPIWLVGGIFAYSQILEYILDKRENKNASKSQSPHHHDAYAKEDEEMESPTSIGSVFCHLIFLGIVLSPFFIACARLQGSNFTTFYILVPFFVVAGLLLCLVGCGIVCMRETPMEEEHEKESQDPVVSPPDGEMEVAHYPNSTYNQSARSVETSNTSGTFEERDVGKQLQNGLTTEDSTSFE